VALVDAHPRPLAPAVLPAQVARAAIALWRGTHPAAWVPRSATLAVLLALALCALSVRAWDPGRLQAGAERRGPEAVAAALALEEAMRTVQDDDEPARLRAMNDYFNEHLAYREDIDNWGQVDYWASPLESLAKGAGDCEDYAIGKYFTLVALGIPEARLRMVYVRANMPAGPTAHMVLAYYATPDAEPLVLDNLDPAIRPAPMRTDLTPIFSFNTEGLWQGIGSIRAQGDPLVRLSRWREVIERARQDGFE
jgi:predicted transglutaminase-like cysteine proteinase